MYFSRPMLVVLLLVIIDSVHSNKLCDYKDGVCVISGVNNALKTMILGVKGVVEPSDPLHMPYCEGEYRAEKVLKYIVKNSTLSGMKSCQFTHFTMNAEDSSFRSEILCGQLVLSHYFEANGYIGPVEIDGQGDLELRLNNYVIKFNCEYGKFTSEFDQKLHFNVKNCHHEFESRGTVEADVKSELNRDKTKSDLAKAYLRQHPHRIEEAAQSPILENYMKIFMKNFDTYLRVIPADVVLPALSETLESTAKGNYFLNN